MVVGRLWWTKAEVLCLQLSPPAPPPCQETHMGLGIQIFIKIGISWGGILRQKYASNYHHQHHHKKYTWKWESKISQPNHHHHQEFSTTTLPRNTLGGERRRQRPHIHQNLEFLRGYFETEVWTQTCFFLRILDQISGDTEKELQRNVDTGSGYN